MLYCYHQENINWHRRLSSLNDQVHVHAFDATEKYILDPYRFLVSEWERGKYLSFRQTEDKNRFLAGRYYVRRLLGFYLQMDPLCIFIESGKNKKPFAAEAGGKNLPLLFNISHSGRFVLIAICRNEVGVDVEEMRSMDVSSIMEGAFSIKEKEYVERENSLTAANRFYMLWTRKEAVLKATGAGLTDRLQDVEVLDGQNTFNNTDVGSMDLEVISFDIESNYTASVCFLREHPVSYFMARDSVF